MAANGVGVGLHRLGVALAIVPVAASLVMLCIGAFRWGQPAVNPPVFRISNEATGKSFDVTYGGMRSSLAGR